MVCVRVHVLHCINCDLTLGRVDVGGFDRAPCKPTVDNFTEGCLIDSSTPQVFIISVTATCTIS